MRRKFLINFRSRCWWTVGMSNRTRPGLPLGGGVAGDTENKQASPVPVTSDAVLFWGAASFSIGADHCSFFVLRSSQTITEVEERKHLAAEMSGRIQDSRSDAHHDQQGNGYILIYYCLFLLKQLSLAFLRWFEVSLWFKFIQMFLVDTKPVLLFIRKTQPLCACSRSWFV